MEIQGKSIPETELVTINGRTISVAQVCRIVSSRWALITKSTDYRTNETQEQKQRRMKADRERHRIKRAQNKGTTSTATEITSG